MLEIVWLTAKLAGLTTLILLAVGTPLAWWLARSRAPWREAVGALVGLPIILPPTVLGFYLLVALGPSSPLMAPFQALGIRTLAFTFTGLVIGSVVYSLPFTVQPLRNAFLAVDEAYLEASRGLGAGRLQTFWNIALPLAAPGYVVAAILTFAHTVGEFGVVLMIGGGIPGKTDVLSIEIYRLVEALDFERAHLLAGGVVAFGFLVILSLLLAERAMARRR